MRVLYDGWSLVHEPLGPRALHLQAVLASLPEGVDPVVALPGPQPPWLGDLRTHIDLTPDTSFGRLCWEQVNLPLIARRLGIKLLHLTSSMAPLFGGLSILISPCDFGVEIDNWFGAGQVDRKTNDFLARLQRSLATGGMARIKGILWPTDLPSASNLSWLRGLTPVLPPEFKPATELDFHQISAGSESLTSYFNRLDLPEAFILYHGPFGRLNLEQLVLSWKWAADAIGDNYPLLLPILDKAAVQNLTQLAAAHNLGSSLRPLPGIRPDILPVLYQRCSAVFHPAPSSPWCGPVRLAMACGVPLVASETAMTDAIVGPAAYLVPPGESRTLGAALVTVIVEEQIARNFSAAASQRSANWSEVKFKEQLLHIYHQALLS
jgi:glycosyltransferase involved in cell wall biosynthesis